MVVAQPGRTHILYAEICALPRNDRAVIPLNGSRRTTYRRGGCLTFELRAVRRQSQREKPNRCCRRATADPHDPHDVRPPMTVTTSAASNERSASSYGRGK